MCILPIATKKKIRVKSYLKKFAIGLETQEYEEKNGENTLLYIIYDYMYTCIIKGLKHINIVNVE